MRKFTQEMADRARCLCFEAQFEAIGRVRALYDLEAEMARQIAYEKGLDINENVLVDFADGKELCVYEGIRENTLDYFLIKKTPDQPKIILRHHTKRGKPCKHPNYYDFFDYIDFISPNKED